MKQNVFREQRKEISCFDKRRYGEKSSDREEALSCIWTWVVQGSSQKIPCIRRPSKPHTRTIENPRVSIQAATTLKIQNENEKIFYST